MEKITAGHPIDVAYGRTPEKALMGVLAVQPAFDTHEVYYHGERPPFMDVVPKRGFTRHDWDQYYQPEGEENLTVGMGDGVTFRRRVRYDAPLTGDPRIAYELENVWLEVSWGDDGRADALFHFSVMLRKSELEDDDTLRDGDHYWRCERMSTEPLDEDTAQRRREQREER